MCIWYLFCGLYSLFPVKERDYLKDAVQCKAILCYRLFTEGYKDTLFICNVPDNLEENLEENFGIKDAGRYIYRHIKDSIPIQVSTVYYLEQYNDSLQFKEDSLMQGIYEEEGVAGLLKNYFRLSYKIYVFHNEQERFPFVGKKLFRLLVKPID